MTSQIYLKTENKTIPVTVTQTGSGWLVIAANFEFELVGHIQVNQPIPRRKMDVLSMTPTDVVRYFEQSPVLNIYAADLRTSILHTSEAHHSTYQLDSDLQAIKHLEKPIKADIAQILLGKRTYGGSGYDRVTAAYNAFYTSTTPLERPKQPKVKKQAA